MIPSKRSNQHGHEFDIEALNNSKRYKPSQTMSLDTTQDMYLPVVTDSQYKYAKYEEEEFSESQLVRQHYTCQLQ